MKAKSITLPCNCIGGYQECGFLRAIKLDDNHFEFCWVKKKTAKRAKIGVCVDDKNLEKLKKFIF